MKCICKKNSFIYSKIKRSELSNLLKRAFNFSIFPIPLITPYKKKKKKRKRKIKRSNNTHLLMKNFLDNNDDDDFLKSQSPNPFKRK